MALPTVRGVSAAKAEGTTTVAPTIPSGTASGELMLALIACGNLNAVSVNNQNGGSWTDIGQAEVGASTTATHIAIFADYYNGTQGTPTFNTSGNNGVARIMTITGARAADEAGPFAGMSSDLSDSDGNTSCSLAAGFSTSDADCLIVLLAGAADDSPTFGASWTNGNLGSITIQASDTTTQGNDSSLEVVTGTLATAGAVGTFANTLTGAVNVSGLVLAIRPPAAGVSLTIADGFHDQLADHLTLGVGLIIADATHGHSADNLALTQHNVLAIQDATHGHSADNLALTQHNVLAIQDATHGHTADNVALEVSLLPNEATHGHTADNVSLTQHHVLAVADASHGHTAENLDLTQHNVLAIADATHGHTAENLALTQHNVLAVDDATHAHAADNLVLTAHEPGGALEIQDAAHEHAADNLTLLEHNILVIADAGHTHVADNLALTQHNVLVIADALHAHTADHIADIGGEFDTGDETQNFVRLRRRRGMGTL